MPVMPIPMGNTTMWTIVMWMVVMTAMMPMRAFKGMALVILMGGNFMTMTVGVFCRMVVVIVRS